MSEKGYTVQSTDGGKIFVDLQSEPSETIRDAILAEAGSNRIVVTARHSRPRMETVFETEKFILVIFGGEPKESAKKETWVIIHGGESKVGIGYYNVPAAIDEVIASVHGSG